MIYGRGGNMLIDEIKKANIQALKDKDKALRAGFSVVINKYMLLQVNDRAAGTETTDEKVIAILQKTVKELKDEEQMYLNGGNIERATDAKRQIEAISSFIPAMMGEDEIRKIIEGLEDRSMKAVMSYFKENYSGRVDMALVSKIARG